MGILDALKSTGDECLPQTIMAFYLARKKILEQQTLVTMTALEGNGIFNTVALIKVNVTAVS